MYSETENILNDKK